MTTANLQPYALPMQPQQTASPGDLQAQALLAAAAPEKPKRTLGLKLVDGLIYGVFNNPLVFTASVAFTYMTKHGHSMGAEGSGMRSFAEFFAKRRPPIIRAFNAIGIKEKAADYATMAFFSFVDGTIFALPVKLLEDQREKMGMSIDETLGTKSANLKAYAAEPPQSWWSVIKGRIETGLIVVPIALTMEATGGNQKIFYKYGEGLANYVKDKWPKFDQWLDKHTIKDKNYFFETGVFEAFYTTVCTIGTYLISRSIAREHPGKTHHSERYYNALAHQGLGASPSPMGYAAPIVPDVENGTATYEVKPLPPVTEKPPTIVSAPTQLERIVVPEQSAAVTA